MKTNGNEITVFRGEEFTIHKEIVNRDGSPFIVSDSLKNPCWLISVANTLRPQEGRVVRNYYLPINRSFQLTVPFNIKDVKTSPNGDVSMYESFEDLTFPLYGYLGERYVNIPYNYAVFECDGEYRFYTLSDDGETIVSNKYVCEIIKTFRTSDTESWKSQDYIYTIQLVSGEKATEGTKYLSTVESRRPILEPTKLKVIEYAQGDLL